MPSIDNGWLIFLGTLFGGAGLKVVESWLSNKKKKGDDATQIRSELRVEITSLREQLATARKEEQDLENDIESWRSKFYDLRDEKTKVDTELRIANNLIDNLKTSVDSLKIQVASLEEKITSLEKKLGPGVV